MEQKKEQIACRTIFSITPLPAVDLSAGQCLSQCIVNTPLDAAKGLMYCSLALHMASPAKRFVPEILNFLTETLTAATSLPSSHPSTSPEQQDDAGTLVRFAPGVLSIHSTTPPSKQLQQPNSGNAQSSKKQHKQQQTSLSSLPSTPLNLLDVLNGSSSAPTESTPEATTPAAESSAEPDSLSFKLSVLHTAVSLLKEAVEGLDAEMDGLPQILNPCLKAIRSLGTSSSGLPKQLETAR